MGSAGPPRGGRLTLTSGPELGPVASLRWQCHNAVMAMPKVLGSPIELNTSVLTGAAVLVGIGAAIAGTGALLGGWSVIRSARRWAQSVERSPIQVATAHWPRAKAAATAGYGRWKNTPPDYGGSTPD